MCENFDFVVPVNYTVQYSYIAGTTVGGGRGPQTIYLK